MTRAINAVDKNNKYTKLFGNRVIRCFKAIIVFVEKLYFSTNGNIRKFANPS